MEEVKLKNGTMEAKIEIAAVLLILEGILDDRPFAFYDLVKHCRDATYRIWGPNELYLRQKKLIAPDGTIHSTIKNVVLSAVSGNGFHMALGNPAKEILCY